MTQDIFSRFCRLPSRWVLRFILSGRASRAFISRGIADFTGRLAGSVSAYEAGNYNAYINSGIIFGMCLICGAGWAHLHSYRASQNWAMPPLPAGGVETTVSGQIDMSELRWRGGELHVTVSESGLSNNVPKEPHQPFCARLFSSQEIALRVQPGCHVRLKVRLQPLGAPLTDVGYDPRFPACRIKLQSGAELALVTNARHLTAACDAVDVVLVPYFRARYPCAAHLVDRRVLKPFATTLVYVKRTQSGLHFVTRIPGGKRNALLAEKRRVSAVSRLNLIFTDKSNKATLNSDLV